MVLVRRSVHRVSRAQATVYLVALVGLVVGVALVVMSPALGGAYETLAGAAGTLLAAFSFAAIFAIAVGRVQRGEVAAEQEGTLGPVMGEFTLMSFGGRLRQRPPST